MFSRGNITNGPDKRKHFRHLSAVILFGQELGCSSGDKFQLTYKHSGIPTLLKSSGLIFPLISQTHGQATPEY